MANTQPAIPPTPKFATPPLIEVSQGPRQVAVADLNGDGILDLAVATDGGVDVLLGKGDGTFPTRTSIGKRGAWALAIADMNNDGIPDLVVNYQGDPYSVGILLGNGAGTFQPPKQFAVGYAAFAVAVGDFNKDGNLDVVVAQAKERSIGVLLGNGDGTLQPVTSYTVPGPGYPESLAVGDFNDDGNLDIAAANGGLHIFPGNGDGTFKPGTDTGPASYIVAADVNLDGRMDIVSTNGVYLNEGGGSVSYIALKNASQLFGDSLAVGDFNNDGKPDIVLAGLGILLGRGDGTFAPPLSTYVDDTSIGFLAVGDFNRDGKLDAVEVSYTSSQLAVYFGNGNGTLNDVRDFGSTGGITVMTMADFNNDGNLDIAAIGENRLGDPQISISLGTGYGTFRPPLSPISGTGIAIATGDFNNDGNTDFIVLIGGGQLTFAIYLGNGDGTFQQPLIFVPNQGIFAFVVGDFNGDGNLDLAALNPCPNFDECGESEIYVYFGNGNGTFTAGGTFDAGVAAESMVAADFNNDGILDLAVTNDPGLHLSRGSVGVLLGNGDGTFQAPKMRHAPGSPQNILAADFNHDGNMDVIVFDNPEYPNTPSMSVMLGNGAGDFSTPITTSISKFTPNIAIADVNGDGFPDLVFGINGIQVFTGNGNGSFRSPISLLTGNPSALVQVELLGNDKLPDVVCTCGSFYDPIGVIVNTGP